MFSVLNNKRISLFTEIEQVNALFSNGEAVMMCSAHVITRHEVSSGHGHRDLWKEFK